MKFVAQPTGLRFLIPMAILLLAIAGNLYAQTTWTGAVSTAWNTAGNWSAGVPDATDDVTIPNVTNDPLISVAGALAKSVTVQSGGILTISAAGTLTINGSVLQGLLNEGTVQNHGSIAIGNVSAVGEYGIWNKAVFNNSSGAQIAVARTSSGQLFNSTVNGVFTNAGSISLGVNAYSIGDGIVNMGALFNNNTGGQINIDRITRYGIINESSGVMNNAGIINIGSQAGGEIMFYGITAAATLNNNVGGQININRCVQGIYAFSGTFSNAGSVTIGALGGVTNLFNNQGSGTFSNNTGGVFKAKGTVFAARFANAGGTLAPGYSPGILSFDASENFANSTMAIEVNENGTAGVDYDRVNVSGTATLGGTLAVSINYAPTNGDQVTILNATAIFGTFSTVTGLPANWVVNYTPTEVILSYGQLPANTWTGNVSTNWNIAGNWTAGIPDATDAVIIPNVTNDPLISSAGPVAKSVWVQSGGTLNIAASGSLSVNNGAYYGIWNQGVVNNNGSLQIGNTGNVGDYGIFNAGSLNNTSGAQISINRAATTGIELLSGTFSNAGTVIIGAIVPIADLMLAETGVFSNNTNGILRGTGNLPGDNFTNAGGTLAPGYSPGKMNFTAAETFANNILAIEVNGTGVAGTHFDQVVVSGTATLGGTLSLAVNYTATIGDQFVIVSAGAISGTFGTLTGLPANWHVVYYLSSVVLTYGLPQSTWTGAISPAWNTAGNWSAGVPDAATDVIIPNATNDPLISVAGALAKSVTVQSGGILTISAAGTLTINGSVLQGLLNEGTVQNHGSIAIGNVSAVGEYGIWNKAVFNNSSGAQIAVARTSSGQLFNSTVNGVFTNAGSISLGVNAYSIGDGIVNMGALFNNNTGGQINIDRITRYGIINESSGVMNNAGIINIGSQAGGEIMFYGITAAATLNNNVGGQININRCVQGIYAFSGTFSNAGSVTIGALGGVTNLFNNQGSGTFSNNTGGVFKAKGTVFAARFANAGGTLAPGYSPGILSFDASENFANSTMAIEVNENGTAGVDYDRVNVSGTATLGGTLAVSINYTPTNGDQVTILNATAIFGTFSTVTGLPAYWRVSYTSTTVILTYDLTNTWTGTVNNNWNTAGNWSAGAVPTAANNVIIPNVTNDPIISVAGAGARTIHVQPGGALTVNATGSLTTNGTLLFNGRNAAIYNQGTMTVKGPLIVKPN
ncbi:MAG: hypothetical protein V4722_22360 [Bacteroidota bacterium]